MKGSEKGISRAEASESRCTIGGKRKLVIADSGDDREALARIYISAMRGCTSTTRFCTANCMSELAWAPPCRM